MRMTKTLHDHGVWAMFAGYDPAVLQWKPGLLVDRPYCEELLERFERAIRQIG
jgi:acetylornithine/succinyldiaminopimelate/putrescine aminotransferase